METLKFRFSTLALVLVVAMSNLVTSSAQFVTNEVGGNTSESDEVDNDSEVDSIKSSRLRSLAVVDPIEEYSLKDGTETGEEVYEDEDGPLLEDTTEELEVVEVVEEEEEPIEEVVAEEVKVETVSTSESDLRVGDRILACNPNSTFYSYMSYLAPSAGSTQGQYLRGSNAWTDSRGIRYYGDYMFVALAKMYGPIGTKYRVTFSNGDQILMIKGDEKSITQTECSHGDGSMIEIIVDSSVLSSRWKSAGTLHDLLFDSNELVSPVHFDLIID